MTKAQRAAKAKRAGAKRRKANAAAMFLKKMNPGRKLPAAVRVKRLAGGGISVTPIKMNAGPGSIRKTKKRQRREFGVTAKRIDWRVGKPMWARKKARAAQKRGRFDPRYFD